MSPAPEPSHGAPPLPSADDGVHDADAPDAVPPSRLPLLLIGVLTLFAVGGPT